MPLGVDIHMYVHACIHTDTQTKEITRNQAQILVQSVVFKHDLNSTIINSYIMQPKGL